jgi:hypothetical protein
MHGYLCVYSVFIEALGGLITRPNIPIVYVKKDYATEEVRA